jgi:hypothetical protein
MRFVVLVCHQSSVVLEIHSKGAILAGGTVPLSGFVPEKIQLFHIVLKEFVAHVAIQVAEQKAIPFADINLPRQANEHMTLCVTVYGSDTISSSDADWFPPSDSCFEKDSQSPME